MYPGDTRSAWPPGLLTDARVKHFWDADQEVGRYYAKHVTEHRMGEIEWDAYFLYAPGVEWRTEAPQHIVSGAPIVNNTDALAEALAERVFQ